MQNSWLTPRHVTLKPHGSVRLNIYFKLVAAFWEAIHLALHYWDVG